MTTAPARLSNPSIILRRSAPANLSWLLLGLLVAAAGCSRTEPVEVYTIPTRLPDQLQAGKSRMLAVMFPKDRDVWFFKITGPEKLMETVEAPFRSFVENVEFADEVPRLSDLPEGWRRGSDKPFRFATINIDTPAKQLDLSISKLQRQDDWDTQVQSNVNRWRGQLGLKPSDDTWAEGESIEVQAADREGIWVDIIGEAPESGAPMSPPFASGAGPSRNRTPALVPKPPPSETADSSDSGPSEPPLKYDRPDGWRDGRMTSMRMAAFNVGPEDSAAELTVIPAGGDLRGNVARWLGQVREEEVADEIVDKAMADATKVEVDGREAQRFFLTGKQADEGTAIDATIIPIQNGVSLFVKMTGPAETVSQQSDAIASFLESLKLNL